MEEDRRAAARREQALRGDRDREALREKERQTQRDRDRQILRERDREAGPAVQHHTRPDEGQIFRGVRERRSGGETAVPAERGHSVRVEASRGSNRAHADRESKSKRDRPRD